MLITIGVLINTYCFAWQKRDSVNYYENKIEITKNKTQKAQLHFKLAQYFQRNNQSDLAFDHLTKALKINTGLRLHDQAMDCNLEIFQVLNSMNHNEIPALPYLDTYHEYAKENKDLEKQLKALMNYAAFHFSDDFLSAKSYYHQALKTAFLLNDTISQAKINSNLGLLYSGHVRQDSARIYFDKSLKLYPEDKNYERFIVYLNYANSFQKENNCGKALEYLQKAEALHVDKHRQNLERILYGKFANCYQALNDFENAFIYLDKYNTLNDSIDITNQNIEISKIKEQFDNEKLRAEKAESEAKRLESEAKRIQNRNLLFGALGLLIFVGLTAYLIHKNTRRKQLIAEQDKALESQKLANVLKEQELTTIDAMIEGQEKERQRIANDLHDDLGGLMTTVKWQFNALQENYSPELFLKTNNLLEEAYQKIRGIAHAKNAGVIAKQGLLKAVKNMAEKVSATNKIEIEVVDYGLENRLDNSLELMLFRIIQELITNIIKHAEAKHATINLTQHDGHINIMVEDDGKGFNPSQVTTQHRGMGISSIDKRVEYLNGTLTIESEPNKGTTVIIDVPI